MGKSSLHALLSIFLVTIQKGEPMTGKELLKTIKRERLQLEKLKKEHQEEERYFQVVHGVNYENVHGSGGRVSTLDDVLERQERERAAYIRRFGFVYSRYSEHLVKAWKLVNEATETDQEAAPGLVYMLEYYSSGVTYEQLAPKTPFKAGYIRSLIKQAANKFEEIYQARESPEDPEMEKPTTTKDNKKAP